MISVALCTYNGENFLCKQLDSILSQSMPVDEIVIRDDCSSDSTCIILDEYSKLYPQINYKRNTSNLGFIKNFESALEDCRGDYIFFSDQDDIWECDKVKISVQYLQESGKFGAFSNGKLIDQYDNFLGDTLFSRIQIDSLIDRGILDKYDFETLCLNGNYVTGATIVITKEAKDILIPFNHHLYHDVWLSVKLSAMHKFGRIDKALISYRIHTNQECGLDMIPKDKYDFLNCLNGNGKCSYLIPQRRHSASIIYLCKLNKQERKRLYITYRDIYWKNVTRNSLLSEALMFFITEIIVFLKTRRGIGGLYYIISKYFHNNIRI